MIDPKLRDICFDDAVLFPQTTALYEASLQNWCNRRQTPLTTDDYDARFRGRPTHEVLCTLGFPLNYDYRNRSPDAPRPQTFASSQQDLLEWRDTCYRLDGGAMTVLQTGLWLLEPDRLPPAYYAELELGYMRLVREASGEGFRRNGLAIFLAQLHAQGIPFGMVTNHSRHCTLATLEAAGVRDYFPQGIHTRHHIISGEHILEKPKPAPDLHRWFGRCTNGGTRGMIAFEEQPANIAAGEREGITMVAMKAPRIDSAKQLGAGALLVAEDFNDPELLKLMGTFFPNWALTL